MPILMTSHVSHNCAHCGLFCKVNFGDEKEAFCCSGCKTVYEFLKSQDLGFFYELRNKFSDKNLEPAKLEASESWKVNNGKIILFVPNVHCAACIWVLEQLPKLCSDVLEVRVDLSNSRVLLRVNENADLKRIADVMNHMGYPAQQLNEDPAISINRTKKIYHYRLAISGAMAAATMHLGMSLSIGEIQGITPSYFYTMGGIELFLCVISLFIAGKPIFQRSLGGLRAKTFLLEHSVSLGISLAFLVSVFHFLSGKGSLYFDAINMILFLITLASYLQFRSLEYFQKFRKSLDLQPAVSHVKENDSVRDVPTSGVEIGSILEIRPFEKVPLDGILLDKEALLDEAILTGESKPLLKNENALIYAGSTNFSSAFYLKVIKRKEFCLLQQYIKDYQVNYEEVSGFQSQLIKNFNKLFLPVVLLLSSFSFVFWNLKGDLNLGLQTMIAILIVSCPCALAICAPLTASFFVTKGIEKGIVIKTNLVFEKLLALKNIFLDKTGTLTKKDVEILKIHSFFGIVDEQLLYSLALRSSHPICLTIKEKFKNKESLELSTVVETPGKGIEAAYKENKIFLGEKNNETIFSINNQIIFKLLLKDKLLDEAYVAINELKKKFQVALLSGDQPEVVERVSKDLGIETYFSKVLPENKEQIIKSHPFSLMVGDGVNDGLALKASHVGVAVQSGLAVAGQSSDVFFLKPGIKKIVDLISLAQAYEKTLKLNLRVSVVYNILAIFLAGSGIVGPLVCGILMPLSSLSVLGVCYLGGKLWT